jgi:hypothetical protein
LDGVRVAFGESDVVGAPFEEIGVDGVPSGEIVLGEVDGLISGRCGMADFAVGVGVVGAINGKADELLSGIR